MITDPFNPAFYTQTNRIALTTFRRAREALRDRWGDEASAAALAGNPRKAHYLEQWAARL